MPTDNVYELDPLRFPLGHAIVISEILKAKRIDEYTFIGGDGPESQFVLALYRTESENYLRVVASAGRTSGLQGLVGRGEFLTEADLFTWEEV